MEGTASYAPVLAYVAEITRASEFMLVDIGCSGGIDSIWRRFGSRLCALAIDPNLAEIDRLRRAETHPGIRYIAGFGGLPLDHPFAKQKQGRSDWSRNPWDRLSVARSLEIMKSRRLSNSEKTAANLWTEVELADASQVITVPEYLTDNGVRSVDFLKIDVDGKDFDVLNSFDAALDTFEILALGLEVNFFGSALETDHSFHNTDRFMKAKGFELFNLTVRRYSLATLPGRYLLGSPAQTEFGRPLQGDALYVRDLGNPDYHEFAGRLSAMKLLNLLCVFAAFNLPDCAAEIALRFRQRLSPLCDVDRLLDLLTDQVQGGGEQRLSYREYMERFEAQDGMFFSSGSAAATQAALRALIPQSFLGILRRLRRAWAVFRGP